MGDFVRHVACPDCGGSDCLALHVEEDGSYNATCWSECKNNDLKGFKSHNKLAKSYLGSELGIKVIQNKRKGLRGKRVEVEEQKPKVRLKKKVKAPITEERIKEIQEETTLDGRDFRGISNEILELYRVRTAYDEATGEVSDRYYPVIEGKDKNGYPLLVGYHRRFVLPEKDFRAVGRNSKECELFGQFRCRPTIAKKLVITGGQEDCMAAKQMFRAYQKSAAGKILPVDFVSGTVGEGSVAEQLKYNYEFIDMYDEVILDMDSDVAGDKAVQAVMDSLPVSKLKVMYYPSKDANQALEDGLEDDYIRAIYSSRKPKIHGFIGGSEMFDEMVKAVSAELIPLPPAFEPLSELLCGGLPTAEIINILAASGIGKTTMTNVLIEFWILNSPYKTGVVSMEAGAGKFLVRLLSGYLKYNISRIKGKEDKIRFLQENRHRCEKLFLNEKGEERFCLLDDKGDLDTLQNLKKSIERMIRQGECKVIIIDPIQDALDCLSVEEQAEFIGWQKKIKARDGVTFINVNHTRKSGGSGRAGSRGGILTEEDMQGTSAIYKSGAVNIILTRDKTAEDPEERNTTYVTLAKARDTGDTGPAGELFYEIKTATIHNKAVYMPWEEEEDD